LGHLLNTNSFLLIQTVLLVAHHLFVLFLLSLVVQRLFVLVVVLVTLTHPNDIISLLLGLLNLLPSLHAWVG